MHAAEEMKAKLKALPIEQVKEILETLTKTYTDEANIVFDYASDEILQRVNAGEWSEAEAMKFFDDLIS